MKLDLTFCTECMLGQKGGNNVITIAGLDFSNITGIPQGIMLGTQPDFKGRFAQTVGIEQLTALQQPLVKHFGNDHAIQTGMCDTA